MFQQSTWGQNRGFDHFGAVFCLEVPRFIASLCAINVSVRLLDAIMKHMAIHRYITWLRALCGGRFCKTRLRLQWFNWQKFHYSFNVISVRDIRNFVHTSPTALLRGYFKHNARRAVPSVSQCDAERGVATIHTKRPFLHATSGTFTEGVLKHLTHSTMLTVSLSAKRLCFERPQDEIRNALWTIYPLGCVSVMQHIAKHTTEICMPLVPNVAGWIWERLV